MDKIDKYALIELIRENPCLWDQGSGSYHLKEMRTRKWKEVAEKMNLSCEEVKFTWQNLRDSFKREIRRKLKGCPKNPTIKWPYFKPLLFLSGGCITIDECDEEPQIDSTREENEDNTNVCNNFNEKNLKRKYSEDATKMKSKRFEHTPKNVSLQALKKQDLSYKDIDQVKKPDLCYEDIGLVKKPDLSYKDIGQVKKPDLHYEDIGLVKKPDLFNEDDDYHFVISLLPFLRKVPEDRKLGVRMALIGTIEQELEMLRDFSSYLNASEYECDSTRNSTFIEREEPSSSNTDLFK